MVSAVLRLSFAGSPAAAVVPPPAAGGGATTDLFKSLSTGLLAVAGADIELDGGVASPRDPAGGVALGRDWPGVTIRSPCSSDSRFKLSNKETGSDDGDAAGRGG